LSSSEITEYLRKKGIRIEIGNENPKSEIRNPKQIQNLNFQNSKPDLVIHTPAIKDSNPQLKFFKDRGAKCLTYPEALGQLTKEYFTIAVSGSHGKSTTTAMMALVLVKAGLDPTVIVGTKLKEFGNSNFRMGKSKYLVIEACEYDDSFLNYKPQIIVVTNIDKEHLDYFKTFKNVVRAFKNFISQLPRGGVLVTNADDKKANQLKFKNLNIKKYKHSQKEAVKIKKILKVPGQHNVSNALAVLAVARGLGIDDKITYSALSEFKGTWRRFEEKETQVSGFKIQVISDYGHHPTEVLATLKAAREKYPNKFIMCVFQPHQYQRTFYLQKDFIKIFRQAPVDEIIITDIYDVAGRENKKIKEKINSQKLVKLINKNNVKHVLLRDIEKYIKQNIKQEDVLIIMGAGDIYKLFDKL
jgi:UDP-N-acetylmuramate--alanine ligase